MPAAERGVYGYLAIANGGMGGFHQPEIFCPWAASRAVALRVPRHHAEPLLRFRPPNHYRNDPFYHFEYLTQEIRVVPGPQSDLFTSRGIDIVL